MTIDNDMMIYGFSVARDELSYARAAFRLGSLPASWVRNAQRRLGKASEAERLALINGRWFPAVAHRPLAILAERERRIGKLENPDVEYQPLPPIRRVDGRLV